MNAVEIVVALVAIVVAARSLGRDKCLPITSPVRSLSRAPASFVDMLRQVKDLSARHRVWTPLLILSFMIIPIGILALEKTHGWNDFDMHDWILVGIAETPIALLALFSMIVSATYRGKK